MNRHLSGISFQCLVLSFIYLTMLWFSSCNFVISYYCSISPAYRRIVAVLSFVRPSLEAYRWTLLQLSWVGLLISLYATVHVSVSKTFQKLFYATNFIFAGKVLTLKKQSAHGLSMGVEAKFLSVQHRKRTCKLHVAW